MKYTFTAIKSPILPNGTYNTALTSKYSVGIQVINTAERLRSSDIAGKAKFRDDLTKDARKRVKIPAIKRFLFVSILFILSIGFINSRIV